jgi:hypothetical protein
MPTPPERFARLLPVGADLTDAQLAELGEIELLVDTNVGAAILAWNAWLARHGISSPRPPPSGTGAGAGIVQQGRLAALSDECRLAAVQTWFAGGRHQRGYIIPHRPPEANVSHSTPGRWWGCSLAADAILGELDLRDREHATRLEVAPTAIAPDDLVAG